MRPPLLGARAHTHTHSLRRRRQLVAGKCAVAGRMSPVDCVLAPVSSRDRRAKQKVREKRKSEEKDQPHTPAALLLLRCTAKSPVLRPAARITTRRPLKHVRTYDTGQAGEDSCTLVTQCSIDRLGRLITQAQLTGWTPSRRQ